MFNNWPLKEKNSLTWSICNSPWYKCFHHIWLQMWHHWMCNWEEICTVSPLQANTSGLQHNIVWRANSPEDTTTLWIPDRIKWNLTTASLLMFTAIWWGMGLHHFTDTSAVSMELSYISFMEAAFIAYGPTLHYPQRKVWSRETSLGIYRTLVLDSPPTHQRGY